MTKALAIILALSVTQAHAALQQTKPDLDAKTEAPRVYRTTKTCDGAKPRKFMKMRIQKLINDKLVDVAIAIVPLDC